jgi:hypothetical protein
MGHLGHTSQQLFAGKVFPIQKNVQVGVAAEPIIHIFELISTARPNTINCGILHIEDVNSVLFQKKSAYFSFLP